MTPAARHAARSPSNPSIKAADLFAGLGGFTEGAEAAGVDVVWAANHWPQAVECHRRNHPRVEHLCQDLQQADWTTVPRHDLLLASPACQGHSKARGKISRATRRQMELATLTSGQAALLAGIDRTTFLAALAQAAGFYRMRRLDSENTHV